MNERHEKSNRWNGCQGAMRVVVNRWRLLLGFISFSPTYALIATTQLNAASFDCSKANTAVEHMICGQDELSKLDDELGKAYAMAIKKAPDSRLLKKQQSEWLNTRDRCDDPACVPQPYVKRIGVLKRIISLVPLEKGQESYFFESEADKLRVIQDVVRQQKFAYSPKIRRGSGILQGIYARLCGRT